MYKQYLEIKQKHPDAMPLLCVGDFYETFDDDAVICHNILGVAFTRSKDKSGDIHFLSGFPYSALDVCLPKLVHAGQRITICENMSKVV